MKQKKPKKLKLSNLVNTGCLLTRKNHRFMRDYALDNDIFLYQSVNELLEIAREKLKYLGLEYVIS